MDTLINTTTDWRCQKCTKLLGKLQGLTLHVNIDKFRYIAIGNIYCACPKCGATNSIQTSENKVVNK